MLYAAWLCSHWDHFLCFLTAPCILFCKKDFMILFLEGGKRREKERERNSVWLSLTSPLLRPWPATQACALTGNRTSDLLVCRPVLNPLSHTRQGSPGNLKTNFPTNWHNMRYLSSFLQKESSSQSNLQILFSHQATMGRKHTFMGHRHKLLKFKRCWYD